MGAPLEPSNTNPVSKVWDTFLTFSFLPWKIYQKTEKQKNQNSWHFQTKKKQKIEKSKIVDTSRHPKTEIEKSKIVDTSRHKIHFPSFSFFISYRTSIIQKKHFTLVLKLIYHFLMISCWFLSHFLNPCVFRCIFLYFMYFWCILMYFHTFVLANQSK